MRHLLCVALLCLTACPPSPVVTGDDAGPERDDAGPDVDDAGPVDRCAHVTCLTDERCVDGSCLPTACGGQTCAEGTACVEEACIDTRCIGVTCDDDARCVNGVCVRDGCGDAGVCGAGLVCAAGQCVTAACVGVSCPVTAHCEDGGCVTGCVTTAPSELRCGDGVDDDCDGQVDCADADCDGHACVDDGRACSVDLCRAGACVHPVADAGVTCRADIGGCDQAEVCSGASSACPADVFDTTCTCPQDGPLPGYQEHDGLRVIPASNFVLRDTDTWASAAATFDALQLPQVGLDVLPLNRAGTRLSSRPWTGFGGGFFWAPGDLSVTYWVPQGLAGGTAGARKLVVVGWHYDETHVADDASPPADGSDKGTRVSFADVTDLDAVTYRHVLLVEPDATRGFKPVTNHAGGLAWAGSFLYEADTTRGVRVFDLSRLSKVSTASVCDTRAGMVNGVACAYGYEYVLPQVGAYVFPSGLSDACRLRFSFVSLDRSTSPPSLLAGEYDNDPVTGLYSRLVRFPMVAGTGRLRTGPTGVCTASGAWYAGNRNLQGAVASGAKFYLNSTRGSGQLDVGAVGSPSSTLSASSNEWAWMPEGAYVSTSGHLWVSTEGHANLDRCVFFARVADLP